MLLLKTYVCERRNIESRVHYDQESLETVGSYPYLNTTTIYVNYYIDYIFQCVDFLSRRISHCSFYRLFLLL